MVPSTAPAKVLYTEDFNESYESRSMHLFVGVLLTDTEDPDLLGFGFDYYVSLEISGDSDQFLGRLLFIFDH